MSTLTNIILFCLAINFCALVYFIHRFFKMEHNPDKCITESLAIKLQIIANLANDIKKEQQKITSEFRKIESDLAGLKFELQRKRKPIKIKRDI